MSALIFADDRPTSCDDDLYQWAMDAEALIRNLHTENTALRVTEYNLRQELQECQDQRRAAFRRIEELDKELDAMRAQIGQGEPVAWGRWEAIGLGDEPMRLVVKESAPTDHEKRIANWFRLYTHPAPQPAQANYLEMIYEYLVSTAPAGYADEAFREVPEEVFAADSRNRISERRASLSQHTGQLPAALGQEEVGTRQAGFDVTSAHPAPQQKPLTDEQDRALCEAYCNAASGEYFKARPQLDSDVNRRIFYAGHRKAWIEWQAAHNIGEKK